MNLSNIVIKEILSVVTVFSPKGRQETTYNRDCYGLSFTTDGQITYTHNNNTFVSNKNNVVILPKGQTYKIHGDKDGLFPVINFECDGVLCDTITIFPIKNIMSIAKEFEHIKNCFIYQKSRLMIMSLFYNMIFNISNANITTTNPLYGAIEFLENNFSSKISNEELANSCHLNEEYFRKQFKKIYGVSPKQYVIDIRLNMAKQMLSEGILKINTISEKCGFSNPYHFCRLFKDKTGLTPSEYMKQNKINKL